MSTTPYGNPWRPDPLTSSAPPSTTVRYEHELRFVQIAADQHGLAGLDRDGRVWQHIPGNGWVAVGMNVMEERRGP